MSRRNETQGDGQDRRSPNIERVDVRVHVYDDTSVAGAAREAQRAKARALLSEAGYVEDDDGNWYLPEPDGDDRNVDREGT